MFRRRRSPCYPAKQLVLLVECQPPFAAMVVVYRQQARELRGLPGQTASFIPPVVLAEQNAWGTGCCASLGTSHRSSFRPSPQPRRASLPARALVSVDYRHGCVNLDRGACRSVRQTFWFGCILSTAVGAGARSLTRAEISAPVHRANLVSAQGQSEALPMADQGAILAFVERLVAAGLRGYC